MAPLLYSCWCKPLWQQDFWSTLFLRLISEVDKRLSCIIVILFVCILIAFSASFRIYQLDQHCSEAAWQLDKQPGNCHMVMEPITWINHTIVSMAKYPWYPILDYNQLFWMAQQIRMFSLLLKSATGWNHRSICQLRPADDTSRSSSRARGSMAMAVVAMLSLNLEHISHKKPVEGVAISGMISPSCMVQWLSVAIQSYLFHPKMVEFRHSSPPLISGSLNSMIDVRMVKNSQPVVEAETVKQPVQFSKMGFLWLAMVMPLVRWLNNVRWCTRWCRS